MNITHVVGIILINEHNEITLVQGKNTTYSVPKGHVEKGETPLGALFREIYEEIGLAKELITLIQDQPITHYVRYKLGKDGGDDMSEEKHIDWYIGTVLGSPKLEPLDPDHPRAFWCALDDVSRYLSHPKDKEVFNHITPDIQSILCTMPRTNS